MVEITININLLFFISFSANIILCLFLHLCPEILKEMHPGIYKC